MTQDFAQITRHIMTSRGWNEAQLAQRLGVSQPTVNRIKKGKQTPGYAIGVALVSLHESSGAGDNPPSGAAA